jgi:hypothetical protein
MPHINFGARAILEKTLVARLGGGQYTTTHMLQVFSGTLTECLHQYEQKPVSQRSRYRITTDGTCQGKECQHDWHDIERLLCQRTYRLRRH